MIDCSPSSTKAIQRLFTEWWLPLRVQKRPPGVVVIGRGSIFPFIPKATFPKGKVDDLARAERTGGS
jgi:hypothetical protein